jgi:uncharacterized protein YndB with AHSA1/START domain
MVEVSYSQVLAHPIDAVFAAASDPERQLQWDRDRMRSVEKISAGPLGKGSRYRGRFKGMGTVEYEYAEYDPPRRFAHRARVPIGTTGHVFVFEPDAAGTRMTQVGTFEPRGPGRLFTPLVRRMLAKRLPQVAAAIDQHLRR